MKRGMVKVLALRVVAILGILSTLLATPAGARAPLPGTIYGQVKDPSGNPAAAYVVIVDLNHKRVDDQTGHVVPGQSVGSLGIFSFSNLPDGSYLVIAYASLASSYASSLDTPVQLAGGVQAPSPLIVSLTKPEIEGTVDDPAGNSLTVSAGLRFVASDGSFDRSVGTYSNGTFKVGGLPTTSTAQYSVQAFAPSGVTAVASTLLNVTVDASNPPTVTLQLNPANLAGSVVLPNGITPVVDAHIGLIGQSDHLRYGTSTRSDGSFVFGTLPPEDYQLTVTPPLGVTGVTAPTPQIVTISSSTLVAVPPINLVAAPKTIQVTLTTTGGSPITDAEIQVVALNGAGSASTTANNNGVYTLNVGPGIWLVRPVPTTRPANWVDLFPPQTVAFTGTSPETKSLSIQVQPTTGTVDGSVAYNTGSTPPAGAITIRIQDATGAGNSGTNDASGNFSIPMPVGTYEIRAWSTDPEWAPPPTLDGMQVVVGNGSTSVGTITFLQKTSALVGQVVDASGNGVSGIPVQAWEKDGSEYGAGVTDATGAYAINVISGTWYIRPAPATDSGYAFMSRPQLLPVGDAATVTVSNFTVLATDTTVNGSFVDATTGTALTGLGGEVTAVGRAGTPGFEQGHIKDGVFTIALPHGQYNLTATFPPGAGYGVATGIQVNPINPSDDLTVTIPVSQTNAFIAGHFLYNGAALTGEPGAVYGAGGQGRNEWTRLDPTNGGYDLNVTPGNWYVRGYLDPEDTGYSILNSPSSIVSVAANSTAIQNFTAVLANATISGMVTDPNGNPLGGVRVWASSATGPASDPHAAQGVNTDASGQYSLILPAGAYSLHAIGARGFLPPAPTMVIAKANQTTTVNLQFRALDSRIVGTVTLNGSPQPNAFVRAYPKGGGGERTSTADANGNYSLRVTGGVSWVIQAVAEVDQGGVITAYESAPVTIAVSVASSVTQDLSLQAASNLPAAVAVTFDVSQLETIVLDDGTEIIIPAGAMGTSGLATLQITPRSEIALDLSDRPINLAYRFKAFDSSGQPIYRFNSPVSIILNYDPSQLPPGTTAAELVPEYWDQATQSWKPADNVIVNTTDHTVTTYVNHFTDYALIAQHPTNYSVFLPVVVNNAGGGF